MSAIPADAATVMLLRPCPDSGVKDIEVLMVHRNSKSSFVPGYHVFPGGMLDPEDYEPGIERFIRGVDRKEANRIMTGMSRPERALGVWVAAIREMFEEVGVLIARKDNGELVSLQSQKERRRFISYRRALGKREIKFSRMLETEGLFLSADYLNYFSHWITPETLPLRYDVRFFIAEAPPRQAVAHDGVELTGHIWLRPSVALKDYEAGKIMLVLPQIMTLVELSRFQTVAEAVASVTQRNIAATLTKIKNIGGRDVEVMPDGAVYESRPPVYP